MDIFLLVCGLFLAFINVVLLCLFFSLLKRTTDAIAFFLKTLAGLGGEVKRSEDVQGQFDSLRDLHN